MVQSNEVLVNKNVENDILVNITPPLPTPEVYFCWVYIIYSVSASSSDKYQAFFLAFLWEIISVHINLSNKIKENPLTILHFKNSSKKKYWN